MVRLHVVPAEGPPFDHAFSGESVIIGRSSSCDLAVSDRFMSRRHARLFFEGVGLMVEDLGSRNGTLVNGDPIEKAGPLRSGDVVRLSGSSITVVLESSGAAVAKKRSSQTLYRSAAELLKPVVSVESNAPTGVDVVRRLADRIKLVNDIHQALCRSLDRQQLLGVLIERVFHHFRPEEAAIFLRQTDGDFQRVASRTLSGRQETGLFSRTLINEVTEKRLAALALDAQDDDRFAAAGSILDAGVRSLVAAPLLDPVGCDGMILLASRAQARQFSEEDMELLTAVASAAALRLRNLSLAEEVAERHRMEQELGLARKIQLALLPPHLPILPGYQLAAGNLPSRTVSGDYYEILTRREGGECVLMIADVAGKGIAASLLTAALEALTCGPIRDGLSPQQICTKVNSLFHERTPPERFATAVVVVLDLASGAVSYVNAGHNPGLVVRSDGEVARLGATGLPLGVFPSTAFETGAITLAQGDILLLYTDGITEALDPEDEEYGIERLASVCATHRGRSPAELLATINTELEAFCRGVPFADDRTLIALRRFGTVASDDRGGAAPE